jgi:Endosomal/lysosomal potassium channel TMEM175
MPKSIRSSRMEAFSDGVFSIAATLLVLGIALHPPGRPLALVLHEWPGYLAYVISFLTIGGAWLAHNGLTDRLERADSLLLRTRRSAPSVFAAGHATPMTAHDAQTEPNQCTEDRRDEGEQPQWPGEAPDQEVESDLLGVLHHEDHQQAESRQRGDRPSTEACTARTVLIRSCHMATSIVSPAVRPLNVPTACLLGRFPARADRLYRQRGLDVPAHPPQARRAPADLPSRGQGDRAGTPGSGNRPLSSEVDQRGDRERPPMPTSRTSGGSQLRTAGSS